MENRHPKGAPWRNFYGRIHGKGLRDAQKRYMADLEEIGLRGVSWEENPDRAPLKLEALFDDRPVWLEIGFGIGEHMIHQAQQNPGVGLIGAEPYVNGVATALGKRRKAGVTNVRIHAGDARDLMDVLPAGSIDKAFLLYPDPWPKKKHHRRRFVTPDHLEPLHAALKPGAEFRIATDIPDYVRQAMEEVPQAGFSWLAEQASDWRTPWADWLSTRYEQKALREGRTPHYLTFRRL